jgi:hypothetical protein
MGRPRRNHTADFKAEVVLAALRNLPSYRIILFNKICSKRWDTSVLKTR